MQSDKPQRTVRVLTYLQRGVHHGSTSCASTQMYVLSSHLQLFSSASFPASPHRGKCAFSKKLNALEVPSPPPNPANLHSTLKPASDFQHLSPSFHTNIRILQCCCSTKILTTLKNGSEGTTFCRIRLFYFKMQHVPPLSLR